MKVRKIYLIACFMFILMATIISVGFLTTSTVSIPTTPPSSDTSDIDDLIQGSQGEGENSSSGSESTSGNTTATVPTFTNGHKCVEYALNILENGKGYKSVNTITCSGTVLGVTEYQNIVETKIRSGEYYYKTTCASSTSSFGKSFYRATYANNKNEMSYRYTGSHSDGQPNWGSSQEDVGTWDYICGKYDMLLYKHLTIMPSRSNTTVTKFDRASNKNFYIVSLSLDISKTPEDYIASTMKEGGLEGFKMGSCKFTFYISKSNGYLVKMIREESYTIQKYNFDVLTKAYSETVFSQMNVELAPQKPY